MSVRFSQGQSMKTTETTRQFGKSPSVQRNSMKGMPGHIKSGQDASDGGLTNSGGIGPKREGPIGKRGSSGSPRMDTAKFRGSSDKSYRATSTGPAGRIVKAESIGKSEREGPKRGQPSRGFHQGGSGKMESLRGRAKTSWER